MCIRDRYLECDVEEVDFDGQKVFMRSKDVSISLKEIGNRVMTNNEEALVAAGAHSSPVSPPPFMVGMAEVEVDKETGKVELIDYAAVVDLSLIHILQIFYGEQRASDKCFKGVLWIPEWKIWKCG